MLGGLDVGGHTSGDVVANRKSYLASLGMNEMTVDSEAVRVLP